MGCILTLSQKLGVSAQWVNLPIDKDYNFINLTFQNELQHHFAAEIGKEQKQETQQCPLNSHRAPPAETAAAY